MKFNKIDKINTTGGDYIVLCDYGQVFIFPSDKDIYLKLKELKKQWRGKDGE